MDILVIDSKQLSYISIWREREILFWWSIDDLLIQRTISASDWLILVLFFFLVDG